jgi:hypothetical protein
VAANNERLFLCPRRSLDGSPVCVSAQKLCNFQADCPGDDDEDEKFCLFHRPVTFFLKFLSCYSFLVVDKYVVSGLLTRYGKKISETFFSSLNRYYFDKDYFSIPKTTAFQI